MKFDVITAVALACAAAAVTAQTLSEDCSNADTNTDAASDTDANANAASDADTNTDAASDAYTDAGSDSGGIFGIESGYSSESAGSGADSGR